MRRGDMSMTPGIYDLDAPPLSIIDRVCRTTTPRLPRDRFHVAAGLQHGRRDERPRGNVDCLGGLSALLSAVHVLTLALGLGAVFMRGRALARPLDEAGWERLLAADSVWGVAAGLWIA